PSDRSRRRPYARHVRRGVRGLQSDHARAAREDGAPAPVARQRHDPRRARGGSALAPQAARARGPGGRRDTTGRTRVRALTIRLFVYGTLVPGGDAWPVLAPWATGTQRADRVAGTLYDTGRGYPAAIFGEPDAESNGVVHGYVVDLEDRSATE